MDARPRSHVDDGIRGQHHVLVMLHHQHGVAHVPQAFQSRDQPLVVPLMKADSGFIEDVEDPHQPRADLGRQPDALAFAAGKGPGGARQIQVVHPHVEQKSQAVLDLLENPFRDEHLLGGKGQGREKVHAFPDGQQADILDVLPVDRDSQAFLLETCAQAGRAFPQTDVSGQVHPHVTVRGFMVAPVQLVEHPFERLVVKEAPSSAVGEEPDLLFPGTVEENILDVLREIPEGGIEIEAVVLGQGVHHGEIPQGTAARPGGDGPFPDGQSRIGDHEVFVKIHPRSQTAAVRAGAVGAVEGKEPGRQFGEADAADRTGILFAEEDFLAIDEIDADQPVGQGGGRFQGIPEALPDTFPENQAVDHHVDIVPPVLVQPDLFLKFPDLSVHPDPDVALPLQLFEFLLEFPFFPANDRRQDDQPGFFRKIQDRLHHGIDLLGADFPAADGTVGNADPGEEEAQVIVYLRNGAHGGTGVVAGGALFDGDGG
ncbi:MAG: hypothetical protein A4E72_02096 [Syntrophus sp. PtaU1.Bin208]|nr:MAG: hypothetical protein A4E72_02096 [Syntrophus sp. PtaU1.Bin208]